jgi:hypothetical protein
MRMSQSFIGRFRRWLIRTLELNDRQLQLLPTSGVKHCSTHSSKQTLAWQVSLLRSVYREPVLHGHECAAWSRRTGMAEFTFTG